MFSGVRAETEGDPILVSPRRSIVELRLKNHPILRTPTIYRVYKGSLDRLTTRGTRALTLRERDGKDRVR